MYFFFEENRQIAYLIFIKICIIVKMFQFQTTNRFDSDMTIYIIHRGYATVSHKVQNNFILGIISLIFKFKKSI
jgi:hypothetical protein